MISDEELRKNDMIFAAAFETFRKNWVPRDRRMAREFERDLLSLVAFAQRAAQEPLIQKISAAMALVSMPPLIITGNNEPMVVFKKDNAKG